MREVYKLIRAIVVYLLLHMFLGTILYLPTLKATIIFVNNKVRVSPDKEVMVCESREADEGVRNRRQQCGRIHTEHTGEDTFMLGLCSLRRLYWGLKHRSCVQGRPII